MTRPSEPTGREGHGNAEAAAASEPAGGISGRVRGLLDRADRIHRRHPVLAVAVAVFKKFGDDRGGHWAALVAYYGFFSLFPLLLVFTMLLGFVARGNEDLQERILESALSQFPIIGDQIRENLGALDGSALALVIGIVGAIWGGMGVILTLQGAMDELWDVPRRARPNFLKSRLRAFLALIVFGVATISASVLAALGATGGSFGWALRILAIAGTFALNAVVIGAAFRWLTVADVRWRQVVPGALLSAGTWMALLALGTWLVDRQLRGATELYGFFAIVLGLLSWLYLGAQMMLLSAELNVVLARGLWPRSLQPPPLTEPDREVLTAEATEEASRPSQDVHVHFGEPDKVESGPDPGPADETNGRG